MPIALSNIMMSALSHFDFHILIVFIKTITIKGVVVTAVGPIDLIVGPTLRGPYRIDHRTHAPWALRKPSHPHPGHELDVITTPFLAFVFHHQRNNFAAEYPCYALSLL